ncbi:hypothetical protein BGZ60DRAFT_538167 [Tricladium varicosporioides]|nr:hypothetical protein BGZ60DRAFT_538167 [Hymenoscyphus varicosporioides]
MTLQSKQWILSNTTGFDNLNIQVASIPPLGEYDVLVKMKAISVNHRDAVLAVGAYPLPVVKGIVAGSDGAGEVIEVGSRVVEFKKGDRVATTFYQDHTSGPLNPRAVTTSLGAFKDGSFREFAVIPQSGLAHTPKSLNWREASTLGTAALTAWNALYGDRKLIAGDTVLVQGTGAVSLFALQFAKAAGATVIATTSLDEKFALLKGLGADHIINYKKNQNWGQTAKDISVNGEGVDILLDIGGGNTLLQSFSSIKLGGVITVIGNLDGLNPIEWPSVLQALMHMCSIRAIAVGNRAQFYDMVKAIDANGIKPILDKHVFKFESMAEAYQYLWDQKHCGKIVIDIE